jgi:hypothetical protein
MLVLVGVAVLALAALFVARPLLLEDSSSDAAGTSIAPTTSAGTPVKPATQPAAKPAVTKVVLLPGLPDRVAGRLRHSNVVVVSVYAGTDAGDRSAVGEARRGAKTSGAGFTSLNVLDEKVARQVQPFIGTASPPVVLVVKRPGKVVVRFNGRVDETVVAQAATNAGASKGS